MKYSSLRHSSSYSSFFSYFNNSIIERTHICDSVGNFFSLFYSSEKTVRCSMITGYACFRLIVLWATVSNGRLMAKTVILVSSLLLTLIHLNPTVLIPFCSSASTVSASPIWWCTKDTLISTQWSCSHKYSQKLRQKLSILSTELLIAKITIFLWELNFSHANAT